MTGLMGEVSRSAFLSTRRIALSTAYLSVITLSLTACAAPPASKAPAAASDAAVSQTAAASESSPRLIEFTLGQHRFALPSNYFVDERGPDFQGSVTLALLWPELTPYPPGNGYWKQTSGPMRNHGVIVSFYLVNVPIDSLPERYVTVNRGEEDKDPGNNLALRIRRPDQFGLEHYIVDLEKKAVWLNRFPGNSRVYAKDLPPKMRDWFVGRDANGRIRTVVKCDDARVPEGYEIRDEALVDVPGSAQWPLCDGHSFSLPEYSLDVSASYHRPILRDWQRIETEVRRIMQAADRGTMLTTDGVQP